MCRFLHMRNNNHSQMTGYTCPSHPPPHMQCCCFELGKDKTAKHCQKTLLSKVLLKVQIMKDIASLAQRILLTIVVCSFAFTSRLLADSEFRVLACFAGNCPKERFHTSHTSHNKNNRLVERGTNRKIIRNKMLRAKGD